MKKALFYTASNVASVVQFGGIGALEGSQDAIDGVPRRSCRRGATCSTRASATPPDDVFSGEPPTGAFYAFLPIDPAWKAPAGITAPSLSWAMTEFLISKGRIGCVPGVDFGANGEGYLRFCFARDRKELTGALESMRELFRSA